MNDVNSPPLITKTVIYWLNSLFSVRRNRSVKKISSGHKLHVDIDIGYRAVTVVYPFTSLLKDSRKQSAMDVFSV